MPLESHSICANLLVQRAIPASKAVQVGMIMMVYNGIDFFGDVQAHWKCVGRLDYLDDSCRHVIVPAKG